MTKKSVLFLSVILAFLIKISSANSQILPNTFSVYNQEQGLISSTISGIKKDRLGFIWLFSENGICRFDGYAFKNIEPKTNNKPQASIRVKAFVSNNQGNSIFFVTQNFLAFVESPNSTYTVIKSFSQANTNCYFISHEHYFLLHNINEKSIQIYSDRGRLLNQISIAKWPSCRILRDCIGDNLIVQTEHEIFAFDILSSKKTCILQDQNLNLKSALKITPHPFTIGKFCLLYKNEFLELNAKELHALPCNLDKNWYRIIQSARQIISTKDAQIYLAGSALTVFANGKFKQVPIKASKNTSVQNLFIATGNKHSVWLIQKETGLMEYNYETNELKTIEAPSNASGISVANNIESILSDGELTWFSSPGNGLIKMEKQTSIFRPFNPIADLKEELNSFSAYKLNIRSICNWQVDQVLVGSLKGLSIFNTKKACFVTANADCKELLKLKETPISNILADPEGDIWISSWHDLQLYCFRQSDKKLVPILNKSNSTKIKGTIRTFYFDNKGNIWLGTPDNLLYKGNWKELKKGKLDHSSISEIVPNRNSIPAFGIIFNFFQSNSTTLLIACEEGLIQYDYTTNTFKAKQLLLRKNKLVVKNIRCIIQDEKNIVWLGSNGQGLLQCNFSNDSIIQLSQEDGLSGNYVYSIQKGKVDELWMGTNNGLSCLNTKTFTFKRFSSKDGLQSAEFNTNASLRTKNNLLLFGGLNGLNCFNPFALKEPKIENTIFVTEVWNNDNEIEFSDNNIRLPFDNNHLKIVFAALGHFRNGEYNYVYQLKGLSNEWINCGNQREASFLKIPPGKYKFRVKVSDCYGNWTEISTPLKITILTPWYRTWLFYLGIVLLIISIIALIIKSKINRIKQFQEIRTSIAKDLHDEVGANLSNITLFLALIKQRIISTDKNDTDTLRLIGKINMFAESSQESMSDIVWMINAKNDQFKNLAIKMKDYANSLSEDIPTKISFSIDSSLNNIKMDMLYRKNLYLFFKEAFNNALKYSNCSELKIDASLKNNQIILIVKDNGIGFNENEITLGNGLNNMKKRAEQVNGQLIIQSELGKGTCITLICPYK